MQLHVYNTTCCYTCAIQHKAMLHVYNTRHCYTCTIQYKVLLHAYNTTYCSTCTNQTLVGFIFMSKPHVSLTMTQSVDAVQCNVRSLCWQSERTCPYPEEEKFGIVNVKSIGTHSYHWALNQVVRIVTIVLQIEWYVKLPLCIKGLNRKSTRTFLDPTQASHCPLLHAPGCLSSSGFFKKQDKFIIVGFKGVYSFYFLFEG